MGSRSSTLHHRSREPQADSVYSNSFYCFSIDCPTSGHGGSGSTNKQQQFISTASVIWGCPAWEGYKENRTGVVSSGGVNLQRCGYSYNYMPKMDIGYPATTVAGFPDTPEKCDILSTDNFKTWVGTDANTKPVWYKLVQVTRQAERTLSGDSNDFELEARAWDGTGPVPQQKLFYFDVVYARKDGAGGAIVPATSFDYYRHGSYPPIENTGAHGFFASNGGKVKFNILYFDGHVSQSNDRTDAYRSLRIQFPSPITK